ncbi:MAG: phosphate ABC transporter permease [Oscillatoriales cyanobacterium RM2_1_1]|nr:phosphate ABC transporter permease [Oscillatoriales cyanobacterium SM2_3_0]NJO47793.1 phosphate ABC transporter permease [Oscillatoriales cyanobacterium RM2_1_1]
MLVPLTREKFEELIPASATSEQYKYIWGKFSDLLRRVLISVVSGAAILFIDALIPDDGLKFVLFLVGIGALLYWLWGPVVEAGLHNRRYRQHPYAGFWQGKILDVYLTEAVTSEQESVNKRGELIITENLERRLNVEVGDDTGFRARVQAPLNRTLKRVKPGQAAQLVVMSYLDDLSEINQVSDLYIPSQNLWVGDYPYLRRDVFIELSRWMRSRQDIRRDSRRPSDPEYPQAPRRQPRQTFSSEPRRVPPRRIERE